MNKMFIPLFKVGKREHLELLKKGKVHFTPLSFFREDGTAFRGDELEGTYLCQKLIIDGIELPSSGAKIKLSHADSDDVLMFCASMLNSRNFQGVSERVCNLTDSFMEEMRKFGQYAVVFDCMQFINSVKNALNGVRCNSVWGPVTYCNKKDHTRMSRCKKDIEARLSDATIYFIKDEIYQDQNEWRFSIDWLNPSSELKRNEDGSLDLRIEPIQMSDIIDLDTAKHL